jgi:hypothetical protein
MNWVEHRERCDDEETYKMEDLEHYRVIKSLLQNGRVLSDVMQNCDVLTTKTDLLVTYLSDEKVDARYGNNSWFITKKKVVNGTLIKLKSLSRRFCARNGIPCEKSSFILDITLNVQSKIIEQFNLSKYGDLRFYIHGAEIDRTNIKTYYRINYFWPEKLEIIGYRNQQETISLECVGFKDTTDLRCNFFIIEE